MATVVAWAHAAVVAEAAASAAAAAAAAAADVGASAVGAADVGAAAVGAAAVGAAAVGAAAVGAGAAVVGTAYRISCLPSPSTSSEKMVSPVFRGINAGGGGRPPNSWNLTRHAQSNLFNALTAAVRGLAPGWTLLLLCAASAAWYMGSHAVITL